MNIAKTNTGVDFFKGIEHKNQGSPDLRSKRSELGVVKDIRFPDIDKGRNGLQIIIGFDNPKLGTPPYWFALGEDAGTMLASIGNRDAVLLAPPRVAYSYHPTNFHQGIAKIVCDNSSGTYSKYQNNQSNNVVAPVATLAGGGSPPGQVAQVKPGEIISKRDGKFYITPTGTPGEETKRAPQIPEKLTPEQWKELQEKQIASGFGSANRGNMSGVADYAEYERLYKEQLRSGVYNAGIDFEAKQAAAQIPPPVASPFEESSVETEQTSSQPVITEAEFKKNLLGR
jgi:hypothetical protein